MATVTCQRNVTLWRIVRGLSLTAQDWRTARILHRWFRLCRCSCLSRLGHQTQECCTHFDPAFYFGAVLLGKAHPRRHLFPLCFQFLLTLISYFWLFIRFKSWILDNVNNKARAKSQYLGKSEHFLDTQEKLNFNPSDEKSIRYKCGLQKSIKWTRSFEKTINCYWYTL